MRQTGDALAFGIINIVRFRVCNSRSGTNGELEMTGKMSQVFDLVGHEGERLTRSENEQALTAAIRSTANSGSLEAFLRESARRVLDG